MSDTLAGRMELLVRGTHTPGGDLELSSGKPVVQLGKLTTDLADGTGTAQANRCFGYAGSGASGSENVDFYDFGGAGDVLGRALTLAQVKLLVIRNTHATEVLKVAASGGGAAWTSPFGAVDWTIAAGGVKLIYEPTGITVTDSTNHILTLGGLTGSEAYSFELLALGHQ